MEKAYFGGGCFWCIEAVYKRIAGVTEVLSGYGGGGSADKPTYHNHGNHAEVIEVTFDPSVVSYEKLLEVFWNVHDPTTHNRQGNDVGPSYRSIILTTDDAQAKAAEKSLEEVGQPLWDNPIVTELKRLDAFTVAEDYHQDYFDNNPGNPYCQFIINPKIEKFEKKFADILS